MIEYGKKKATWYDTTCLTAKYGSGSKQARRVKFLKKKSKDKKNDRRLVK